MHLGYHLAVRLAPFVNCPSRTWERLVGIVINNNDSARREFVFNRF
jgi:hypothetical protein